MKPIFGEYPATLDPKGRFLFPAGLLRQLPAGMQQEFVINRGLDNCLTLFPLTVWQEELAHIHSKNQYVIENRTFARLFQSGAQPVELDGSKRILVPKRLQELAHIEKDIILIGANDRVEIWAEPAYQTWLTAQAGQMEILSQKVMQEEGPRL